MDIQFKPVVQYYDGDKKHVQSCGLERKVLGPSPVEGSVEPGECVEIPVEGFVSVELPSGLIFKGLIPRGSSRYEGEVPVVSFQSPAWCPDAKVEYKSGTIDLEDGTVTLANFEHKRGSLAYGNEDGFKQRLYPNGSTTMEFQQDRKSVHLVVVDQQFGDCRKVREAASNPVSLAENGQGVIIHTPNEDVGMGWLVSPDLQNPHIEGVTSKPTVISGSVAIQYSH